MEEAVKNMYEKRNEAAGGGGWKVTGVKILKSRRGNHERHYYSEEVVKGVLQLLQDATEEVTVRQLGSKKIYYMFAGYKIHFLW
jgi:hypothetical protein